MIIEVIPAPGFDVEGMTKIGVFALEGMVENRVVEVQHRQIAHPAGEDRHAGVAVMLKPLVQFCAGGSSGLVDLPGDSGDLAGDGNHRVTLRSINLSSYE